MRFIDVDIQSLNSSPLLFPSSQDYTIFKDGSPGVCNSLVSAYRPPSSTVGCAVVLLAQNTTSSGIDVHR
ncbi:hypothetical protein C5167_029334 [Papaver somniferum]|nr:hypothetical protein C5167_029334 [Papaver somniferum]